MSEESQEDTTSTTENDGQNTAGTESVLTLEDAIKEIGKLRKEAGSRRLKNKETLRKLDEYDEWKKSQMSEVERAKAEKAELEQTVLELRREKWQIDAAAKAGLDPDFADRIRGDSVEEMVADAKRMAAKLGTKSAQSRPSVFGGRSTGRPVGTDSSEDATTAFNNAIRGNRDSY